MYKWHSNPDSNMRDLSASSSTQTMDMYYVDEWPTMEDGSEYDGKNISTIRNPFRWDVNLLVKEVERILKAKMIDIPDVSKGSNSYGFHFQFSDHPDVVARLARSDVNIPDYDGFTVAKQVSKVEFQAAVYNLLLSKPDIPASLLLYHRAPVQHANPEKVFPKDISGRGLMLFQRQAGENGIKAWDRLDALQIACVLDHAANIRASLFDYDLTSEFCSTWFLPQLFEHKPTSLPFPVDSTRAFCVGLFTQKIEATIGNIGDRIGWESDNAVVGPEAFAAKTTLLQFVTHIFPQGEDDLYRLVLDHSDYGMHNVLIDEGSDGNPRITSVFDWETACIVPAILSDSSFIIPGVKLVDSDGAPTATAPTTTEVPPMSTREEFQEYTPLAWRYCKTLFEKSPGFLAVTNKGKDARYLWFTLRAWRGKEPERFFGDLGRWAKKRMKEHGINSTSK